MQNIVASTYLVVGHIKDTSRVEVGDECDVTRHCHSLLTTPTIDDSPSRQFGGETGLGEEMIQDVNEGCYAF